MKKVLKASWKEILICALTVVNLLTGAVSTKEVVIFLVVMYTLNEIGKRLDMAKREAWIKAHMKD